MKSYDGIPAFLQANPEIELPIPGARGWLLQGAAQQMVVVEFSETLEVPVHAGYKALIVFDEPHRYVARQD